ncbi:uncharacterized protein LOC125801211 isoform X2 [Astyanax mexicanus]|uniref:uncharacterized protein LOC125801211 isoform X2 n=1 Tax=Astyanax mexicanus TaxID=7994 RepID=UPI0020CAC2D5|nr:uncharacterized protein LOC125801211 isoform X2 [Astyanax mexicanus]
MTRSKTLEIIPCPESGYTPLYLTTEAGVGSSILYVRPLQANLSMERISTPTSSGGPTIQCLYCKQFMRQASIPTHVDVCSRHNSDGRTGRHGNNRRREHIEAERTQDGIGRHQEREGRQQEREGRQQEREGRQQEREDRQQEREDGQQKETEDGNTTPGEMGNRNSTDNEHRDLRQRQSGSCTSEEWKTEPDITKAVDIYRHQLLKAAESEEDLTIKLNMGHSPEDRERAILQFYKAPNINWARNLTVVLQGDAALGDGVKRFFFSQTISKLQFGFELNIEGPGKTLFFLGEEDHQLPSTSKILLDSGLYVVAGRMIGHSILHGGPGLSSLTILACFS